MKKTLGLRLKSMRESCHLTQKELAEALGVATSVIAGAETKRGISKKLAKRLAEYFNTSIEYWIDSEAEKELIESSEELELTHIAVNRLIKEGMIKDETFINDEEIMDMITKSLIFDIKVLLKKKGY